MAFLRTFWKILTKQLRFRRALPLKISIYWLRRRFWKNFRVTQPKMNISKEYKRAKSLHPLPKSAGENTHNM